MNLFIGRIIFVLRNLFWILILLSVFPSVVSRAQGDSFIIPSSLSFDEALRIFRTRGFDLFLADASVNAAKADLKTAGGVSNPTLSVELNKTFGYDPKDPLQCPGGGCSDLGVAIGVSDQALWDVISGKRGLRLKVAREALEAAKSSRQDASRTLEFQVKQQYVQAYLAQRMLIFAKETQVQAQKTLELNQVRYHAGAISEVDVLKAETAKLLADQAVDIGSNNARLEKIKLAYWLGMRAFIPDYDLSTDFSSSKDRGEISNISKTSLLEMALAHRPDLGSLKYQKSRALASIDLAKRQRVPEITWSLQYSQTGVGQYALQPPTLMFGLSFTLPLFYQYQGEIAKSQVDLFQQDRQYEKLEAQIVSEVESSYGAYLVSRGLLLRMETQLLRQAKRMRDLVSLQYQKGSVSLLEYLDAERTYTTTNSQYMQELADYWNSVFQLEQVIGAELRKID